MIDRNIFCFTDSVIAVVKNMSFPAQVFCKKYQYIDVVSNFGDRLKICKIAGSPGDPADFSMGKFMNAKQDFKANVRNADKFRNMVCRLNPENIIVMSDIS